MCILDCTLQEKDCICFHALPWLTWLGDTLMWSQSWVWTLQGNVEFALIFWSEIGFLNLQFYKRQLSILMESEQESKYCWDHIWKNSLKFMFHKRVSKGFGGVRGETFRRINTKDGITNQENHQNWKNYGHNSMSVMT